MDDVTLAQTMNRLTAWMDSRCRPTGFIQHSFERAPLGTTYVCISPREDGPYASSNHNRVHLCVARLTELFVEAGVGRFFAWLSPGPDMAEVRSWLVDAGLSRVPYVAYPTLVRDTSEPSVVTTDLEVRELAAGEAGQLAGRLDEVAWPEYLRSAGAPGFYHFMAFDRGQPVASAVLCAFAGVGYLRMALTAESARRRGAQQALIAKRIEKARALGATTIVSETLSILPISLSNLRKAGFQPLYEKEVYQTNPVERV